MGRLILWLVLALSIPLTAIHLLKPKPKIKQPSSSQLVKQEVKTTPTPNSQSEPTVSVTKQPNTSSNQPSINKNLLIKVIRTYLENHLIKPTNPKGKVFCEDYLYGWQGEGNNLQAYVWAYCQEFYPRNIKMDDVLGQGEGISEPILVKLSLNGKNYQVLSYQEPQESDYNGSIKRMFPTKYAELAIHNKPSTDELVRKAYERARNELFKDETYSY